MKERRAWAWNGHHHPARRRRWVGGDIAQDQHCNVKPECVIENLTMPSLYQCPLMLHTGGLVEVVCGAPEAGCARCRPDRVEAGGQPHCYPQQDLQHCAGGHTSAARRLPLRMMESLYPPALRTDSQVEIRWEVESEDLTDQAPPAGSLCRCGRHHHARRRLWRPRLERSMIRQLYGAARRAHAFFGIYLGMHGHGDRLPGRFWATRMQIPANSPGGKHNVLIA